MKKLIILSFVIISSATMTSCTADAIPENVPTHVTQADGETGGQNGQTIPPKP
jgi:hypothetical protein